MRAVFSNKTWARVLGVVAVVFGLVTLKEGGGVLFGAEAARTAAGNYVPFVVWSNFLSGFAYVAAGVGLGFRQRWSPGLAGAIFGVAALTLAALAVHIVSGEPFEQRTLVAMSLRTIIWGFIALSGWRLLRKTTVAP